MAGLSDAEIEKVALDWSTEFNSNGPLQKTPAYQALVQLHKVAQDAVTQKHALNITFIILTFFLDNID